jgi:hypothetical protein
MLLWRTMVCSSCRDREMDTFATVFVEAALRPSSQLSVVELQQRVSDFLAVTLKFVCAGDTFIPDTAIKYVLVDQVVVRLRGKPQ